MFFILLILTNQPNLYIYLLLKEAGVPGENPRMHKENMQIPHRKVPDGISTWTLRGESANHCTPIQN